MNLPENWPTPKKFNSYHKLTVKEIWQEALDACAASLEGYLVVKKDGLKRRLLTIISGNNVPGGYTQKQFDLVEAILKEIGGN